MTCVIHIWIIKNFSVVGYWILEKTTLYDTLLAYADYKDSRTKRGTSAGMTNKIEVSPSHGSTFFTEFEGDMFIFNVAAILIWAY